jgi:hypothetical protein
MNQPNRHIGGSILSSGDAHCYKPQPFGDMMLEVKPSVEMDTHFLVIHHTAGTSILAEHPNGHSCRALAERMIAGDADKVNQQLQYIEDCGGMVRPRRVFSHYLSAVKDT